MQFKQEKKSLLRDKLKSFTELKDTVDFINWHLIYHLKMYLKWFLTTFSYYVYFIARANDFF